VWLVVALAGSLALSSRGESSLALSTIVYHNSKNSSTKPYLLSID